MTYIIKIDDFERKLLVQAVELYLHATYEASRGDMIVGASVIDTINDLSKRLLGAEEVGARGGVHHVIPTISSPVAGATSGAPLPSSPAVQPGVQYPGSLAEASQAKEVMPLPVLDREIEVFNRMKPDLEQHHMDKFVVIKDSDLVGAFDTIDAAASEAVRRFGRGPYLIRQIGAPPMTLPASVLFRDATWR